MARIVKRLRNGPYSVMIDGQNNGAHKVTKTGHVHRAAARELVTAL